MALDPVMQDILAKARLRPIDWRASVDQVRAAFWKTANALEAEAPIMAEQRDLCVDGGAGPRPARLYTPFAVGTLSAGLVFFHGGGFVLGGLKSHEMVCRRLAAAGRVRVLSVDYRLAPEHRFPAAPDDAIAAVGWAFANAAAIGVAPERLGVAGDSAGGNLAAVAAIALKARPGPRLRAQLLIYPCTQFLKMTPSQLRFKEGYMLTQAAQDYFRNAYLGEAAHAHDWRASPLVAPDLSGLPPAYVVTAGFDPLLDEGKAYADKLAASGAPTVYREYADQVHGFFNMTAVSRAAREAIEAAGRWAGETLNRAA
jgi:acetyl esterase